MAWAFLNSNYCILCLQQSQLAAAFPICFCCKKPFNRCSRSSLTSWCSSSSSSSITSLHFNHFFCKLSPLTYFPQHRPHCSFVPSQPLAAHILSDRTSVKWDCLYCIPVEKGPPNRWSPCLRWFSRKHARHPMTPGPRTWSNSQRCWRNGGPNRFCKFTFFDLLFWILFQVILCDWAAIGWGNWVKQL